MTERNAQLYQFPSTESSAKPRRRGRRNEEASANMLREFHFGRFRAIFKDVVHNSSRATEEVILFDTRKKMQSGKNKSEKKVV